MAHEKLPAQTFKLTLPCTASYLGLAAVLTVALDVLIISLGVTGQPPDTPGVLPVLFAFAAAVVGLILALEMILMIAFLGKLNLWRSAAIGWALSGLPNGSSNMAIVRKLAILPFRRARIGLPLSMLTIVVTVLSGILIRFRFWESAIGPLDGLSLIGVLVAATIVIMEIMHLRAEKKYSSMSEADLKSTVEHEAVYQLVPADITAQLAIIGDSPNRSILLVVSILLTILWICIGILLIQL
jgi:hypothetical protein